MAIIDANITSTETLHEESSQILPQKPSEMDSAEQ